MNDLSREEVIELFDIYGSLLTDKQRDYIEHIYFYDLSFFEVADIFKVSRNGVFDQVKKAIQNLIFYDEKLNLRNKYKKIEDILNNTIYYEKILDIIKE